MDRRSFTTSMALSLAAALLGTAELAGAADSGVNAGKEKCDGIPLVGQNGG